MTRRLHSARHLIVVASLLASTAPLAWGKSTRRPGAPLAQHLVEELVARHPNVHEAGILAETHGGCFNIGSADKGDLSRDALTARTRDGQTDLHLLMCS